MTSHTDRVVVLVDMDCFYCQVEEKLNPKLDGKPIAVVQYNQWRGGGIIAVNYPARDRGVTRHMRGNEAKEKCPEIELVRVPNVRGKADLTKYREAGKRVAEVLQDYTPLLERASVDEAYMDITESVNKKISEMKTKLTIDSLKSTHVVGLDTKDFIYNCYNSDLSNESNLKLLIGGAIVEEIRAAVYERTGYRCSAGIAHNKILAKLSCGLHKPNQQTILPQEGVSQLYETLPLKKIKSLGGKFGNSLSEDLNITYMGELIQFSERDLMKKYDEKTALWLYNIARGIDLEPVTVRLVSKSIGCCKKFPGKTALKTVEDVTHWISELSTEIAERLEQDMEENNRRAKQMVLSFAQPANKKNINTSKTINLNSYDAKKIANDSYETLRKLTQKPNGSFNLTFLGISVGKFEDIKNKNDITTFFKNVVPNKTNLNQDESIKNTSSENNDSKLNDLLQYLKNNSTNAEEKVKNDSLKTLENNSNTTAEKINNEVKNTTNESLNLSDIEQDAENNEEMNLNQTLKDMENIKSNLQDSDHYSDTTVEEDFSEQLANKKEYPYILEESDKSSEPVDTSKSFFMKYLQKSDSIFTPPSAIDQQSAGCSYKYVSPTPNSNNNNDKTLNICQDSNSSSIFDEVESNCPECNKKVHQTEFISHMDFHLAEKLMAEEREIFQTEYQAKKLENSTKKQAQQSPKTTKNKSVKRKLDNNCSIISFLAKDNDNDKENADTQLCPECDKRIRIEDYACHLDYHTAKKLHLELNPVKTDTQLAKNKSIITKTKNSCKKSSGIASISNFFKSVQN